MKATKLRELFQKKKEVESTARNDWCLILQILKANLSKLEVAKRLALYFPVSHEEALQLLENAPIILIEGLPFDSAAELKDFFASEGVDTMITGDPQEKRRCYKAVWPEPLNLGKVLNQIKSKGEKSEKEIACTVPQELKVPEVVVKDPFAPTVQSEPRADGSESEEGAKLRGTMRELEAENRALRLLESEFKEIRKRYDSLEEIYHALSEEKNHADKRLAEVEERLRNQRETDSSRSGELESLRTEKAALANELDGIRLKYEVANKELEKLKNLEKEYGNAQMIWARQLAEKERMISELKDLLEDSRKVEESYREKSSSLEAEFETARALFQKKLAERDEFLERQNREMQELRRNVEVLEMKNHQWQAGIEEIKTVHEKEAVNQRKYAEELEHKCQTLERELEMAQKQIRDFLEQIEQQEVIQKRVRLTGEIAGKEGRLQELVDKQTEIETEIAEREKKLKGILLEQQEVEKEIIRGKQAQKHLLEQGKLREKVRRERGGNLSNYPNPALSYLSGGEEQEERGVERGTNS